jgi:SAM-dependent methyltransferase
MKISDIVSRQSPPVPWEEADNIPWNDPAFSERMLREHLTQDHDAASRRSETIDQHVDWIHNRVLAGKPSRILDLGCGPGLYALRLAKLGHECVGIDFSPASISYARERAESEEMSIRYVHEDIRQADFGTGFDLVTQIYGEFNVFCPADAKAILKKAHSALAQGGALLIEPHTFDAIGEIGRQPCSWHSANEGLFLDRPYLCLQENFWDQDSHAATSRYFIIDTGTGGVTRLAASYQAYTDDEYHSLLSGCGFSEVRQYPSLTGIEEVPRGNLIAIVAMK